MASDLVLQCMLRFIWIKEGHENDILKHFCMHLVDHSDVFDHFHGIKLVN